MSKPEDDESLLDEQKYKEYLMARPRERFDPMEIVLSGTDGLAKLEVQNFFMTDLGVRVVISLKINWDFDEDEPDLGDWLEYARDTVDLWSAADRERFIKYCCRRLKTVSYLTWDWRPVQLPQELDYVLMEIEDRIQMSIS